MADLKISQLAALAGANLATADELAIVDNSASETKKITVTDLVGNATTLIADATIPGAKILFSAGGIAGASIADAGISTAKVADDAITAAKLGNESTVDLVTTLPGTGAFTGQIALDTDDSKIYIWNGSAWLSVKGAGSVNVVNGSTTGVIDIVTSTSGDTVSISATLDATTGAAEFLAGPTGSGGAVSYRAIASGDMPTATTSAKGAVQVNGSGLTLSGDTVQIDNTVTAETTTHNVVQYDAKGLVTAGRAITAGDMPVATASAKGAMFPGTGLTVSGLGELDHSNSVTGATAAKVTFDAQGHVTAGTTLIAADIPDISATKITTGTLDIARIGTNAVTGVKLANRSTALFGESTPTAEFIGQLHFNSISRDIFIWDGNVWQPIGISVGEIILAGTYNAATNLIATVTSEGTAAGFVVGSALPAAASANSGYYLIVSEAGTGTAPAPTVSLNPPDFLLSNGTTYTEIDVSDTVTSQTAINVAFTAAGNISATNVQAAIEELDTEKVGAANPTFTGNVTIGTGGTLILEGATANAFETTLSVTDPTADRTITFPDVTGTAVTTGDTGTVTNAMLGGSIAYTKLAALTGGNIVVGNGSNVATSVAMSGDITINNAGVTAIGSGVVVNADVSATADIAFTKLANLASANILVGNSSNEAASVAVSGDVTITNAGVTSISAGVVDTAELADDAVTAAKLADTAVTAGSYTAADITVDAQGRITSAGDGSSATTIASQAEAEAGTENTKMMTPLRVAQAIAALGGSVIQSIQRGVITTSTGSGTATITAVDVDKTMLNFLGHTSSLSGSVTTATLGGTTGRIVLTNTTTVTFTRGSSGTGVVSYEVIEFK